jgi:hypothetical protein
MTALTIMLLVGNFVMWDVMRRRRDVSPLLALALLSYLFLWNAYPAIYGITLLDWADSPASRGVYERLVVAHLGTLLVTLTVFAFLPGRVVVGIRDALGRTRSEPGAAVRALAVGGLVYVVGVRHTLALRGGSYFEAASFVMSAGSTEAGQIAILDIVSYFVLCLSMACIVDSWPRQRRIIAMLAWGVIAVDVVSSLLQAMRAVILLPVTLLIATNLQRARDGLKTHWKATVLVLGATVLAAPLLAAAVGVIRLGGSGSLDVKAVQQGYDVVVANLTLEQRVRLAAQELNTKFDAFTYGAVLLETDGIGTAGWQPYTSSLLSPIPRLLLPDKPVPTSKNGDNTGTPYRVAGQPYGNIELGMVVPVSAAGVTLWELGYWGLVLVVLMNLLAFIIANSLLAAPSLIGRALGVSLLSLPTTEFLYGAPSGLVRDLLRVGLYLMLFWFAVQAVQSFRRLSSRGPLVTDPWRP